MACTVKRGTRASFLLIIFGVFPDSFSCILELKLIRGTGFDYLY